MGRFVSGPFCFRGSACLPDVDFATAGDVVVNPFGIGELQAYTAVGGRATHGAIGHVLRGGGL